MIYTFKCQSGHRIEVSAPISDGPPAEVECECGESAVRDWQSDIPMIDTSGCRDASDVPEHARVRSAWDGNASPEKVEAAFKRQVTNRRKEIRSAGGQRGTIRQTHAVPTHLYHGKIKETGDKNYWNDPKNLNRHKECKVDD